MALPAHHREGRTDHAQHAPPRPRLPAQLRRGGRPGRRHPQRRPRRRGRHRPRRTPRRRDVPDDRRRLPAAAGLGPRLRCRRPRRSGRHRLLRRRADPIPAPRRRCGDRGQPARPGRPPTRENRHHRRRRRGPGRGDRAGHRRREDRRRAGGDPAAAPADPRLRGQSQDPGDQPVEGRHRQHRPAATRHPHRSDRLPR